jgi:hypothetical protein
MATFITPFSSKLYSFLLEYKNISYLSYIKEWLPIFQPPIIYFFILYLAIFFSLLSINKKILIKKNNLKIFWWILNFITLLMAIKAKRNGIIFLITSFPITLYFLEKILTEKEKSFLKEKINKYLYTKFIKIFFIIMLFLTLSSLILQTQFCKNPFIYYKKSCPVAAINYIKNNNDLNNLKLFNAYGWGGCLIWNWPEKKIFIDGRMPQTKYKNQTIIEEYIDFKREEKIEEKIEEHNIEIFLIKNPKSEKENNKIKNFETWLFQNKKTDLINIYPYSFLNSSDSWTKIFENNSSLIYVKK